MDRWKRLKPSLIIRNDRIDSGLLKHDLGNPDLVGSAGVPPGEVPFTARIPTKKCPAKLRCGGERSFHGRIISGHWRSDKGSDRN